MAPLDGLFNGFLEQPVYFRLGFLFLLWPTLYVGSKVTGRTQADAIWCDQSNLGSAIWWWRAVLPEKATEDINVPKHPTASRCSELAWALHPLGLYTACDSTITSYHFGMPITGRKDKQVSIFVCQAKNHLSRQTEGSPKTFESFGRL